VQEPLPTVAAPEAVERTPETDGAQTTTATAGAVSKRVMPEILPAAQGSIQGKVNVRIRVTVDAAGNVSNAAFESQGRSRYFARAAQDAAWQWKFRSRSQADKRLFVCGFLEFESRGRGPRLRRSWFARSRLVAHAGPCWDAEKAGLPRFAGDEAHFFGINPRKFVVDAEACLFASLFFCVGYEFSRDGR